MIKKNNITTEFIKELFSSFNKTKVLIIGDVMIDSYISGKVERISAEAPVPIVAVTKKEKRLGGAANVALNIQALGATPILCTSIGNDQEGSIFLKLLKDKKITTAGILQSKNRTTTVKTRVLGNNSQLIRIDEENDEELGNDETNQLIKKINELLDKQTVHVIIFEDYDKGVITKRIIEEVVRIAKKKNIPVCVDPKKKNFNHYKEVHLFKPNIKELHEGTKIDISGDDLQHLHKVISSFRNKQKIETILVTLAEKGMVTHSKATKKHIPAHVRSIVDVSGAGDTVISVAALCRAQGCDDATVAAIANLAGGLVCEQAGVVPINKELLLQEVLSFNFGNNKS